MELKNGRIWVRLLQFVLIFGWIIFGACGGAGDGPSGPNDGDAVATGNIAVSTTTSGADLDQDGYTLNVDGSASRQIGINDNHTYTSQEAGEHTVTLSGIATNCSVADNPHQVIVEAAKTASLSFTVVCDAIAGEPAQLAFVVEPSNTNAGEPMMPPVKVAIQDAAGNVVTTATNTVSIVLDPNPLFPNIISQPKAASGGYVEFDDLIIDTPGVHEIAATSTGLASATSVQFEVLSVGPTAPSNLAVSVDYLEQQLTWADNSSDETGFEVQASQDQSFPTASTFVFNTNANETSLLLIAEPFEAGTWYYRVRSFNADGFSAFSNTVSGTVEAPPAPLHWAATATTTVGFRSPDSAVPALADRTFAADPIVVGCEYVYAAQAHFTLFQCWWGLLAFDGLETQLAGREIISATLKLWPTALAGSFNSQYYVKALGGPWNPNTVTFNTAPIELGAGEQRLAVPTTVALPLEFDVTYQVQQWASGTWQNNGLIVGDIMLSSLPQATLLYSTEFAGEDYFDLLKRPALLIEYR